jgi:hypothetical protein
MSLKFRSLNQADDYFASADLKEAFSERSMTMRNSGATRYSRGLMIICVALFAFATTPLLSGAQTSTSVNIVNNSTRVIRNVYLSHVDSDDWSADQLANGATIGPGQSSTISNLACDQTQVKVIAEDQDGCFLSTVINCGDSATWTVTNDTAADCGGN